MVPVNKSFKPKQQMMFIRSIWGLDEFRKSAFVIQLRYKVRKEPNFRLLSGHNVCKGGDDLRTSNESSLSGVISHFT